jgi:hypothetical protein
MVMSRAGPGPNNDCAGEDQQQFTRTNSCPPFSNLCDYPDDREVPQDGWSGGPFK